MSTYIRKYAKYINEKAVAYRVMAFDFCKVKRGKEDGLLRTMAPEKVCDYVIKIKNMVVYLGSWYCTALQSNQFSHRLFFINAICLRIAILVDDGTSQRLAHMLLFVYHCTCNKSVVLAAINAILDSMRTKPIEKERRVTSVFLYFVAFESTSNSSTTDRFSLRI